LTQTPGVPLLVYLVKGAQLCCACDTRPNCWLVLLVILPTPRIPCLQNVRAPGGQLLPHTIPTQVVSCAMICTEHGAQHHKVRRGCEISPCTHQDTIHRGLAPSPPALELHLPNPFHTSNPPAPVCSASCTTFLLPQHNGS
jgi:hypothetical protein